MKAPAKSRKLSLSSKANLLGYSWIFGLLQMMGPPSPRPFHLTRSSRVLVFSSAGLGDSLLDSVAIRALAETFPGINIEAVVHHRRPDISRHNPFLRRLHLLRKGPLGFIKLWRDLMTGKPWDAILYLSCHDPEARCLGFLLNKDATVSLSWRTTLSSLCAWNLDEPGLRRAHLARQALRVAEQAGATTSYPRMIYMVDRADRKALDERLAGLGLPAKPGVIFQLGGGGAAYRDWPVEHFLQLARMLQAAGKGPLFILGGPDHRLKADRFSEAAQAEGIEFHDAVGKLPLPLSAALIERARCLVSTDTGIMHLGFALGTPTVALLHCSPGCARVGPLADEGKHAILELPRPEGYRSPSDALMSNILPEAVFPLVENLLQRSSE